MRCAFCGTVDQDVQPVRTASLVGSIPIKRSEAFTEDAWRVCPPCRRKFWRKTVEYAHSIRVFLRENRIYSEWDGCEIATTTEQNYVRAGHAGRKLSIKAKTQGGRKMFGSISVHGMKGVLRAYGSHPSFIQDITVDCLVDGSLIGQCMVTRWQNLRNGELSWCRHAMSTVELMHENERDEITSAVLAYLMLHHGGAGYGTKFRLTVIKNPTMQEDFADLVRWGLTYNDRIGVVRAGSQVSSHSRD